MGVAVSDFIGEADDLFPLMVLFGAGGAGSGRDWIPVASFQCRDGREVRQGRDGDNERPMQRRPIGSEKGRLATAIKTSNSNTR